MRAAGRAGGPARDSWARVQKGLPPGSGEADFVKAQPVVVSSIGASGPFFFIDSIAFIADAFEA